MIFGAKNSQKLYQNEDFRGPFQENNTKMKILGADFMKIARNCTKMTILETDL